MQKKTDPKNLERFRKRLLKDFRIVPHSIERLAYEMKNKNYRVSVEHGQLYPSPKQKELAWNWLHQQSLTPTEYTEFQEETKQSLNRYKTRPDYKPKKHKIITPKRVIKRGGHIETTVPYSKKLKQTKLTEKQETIIYFRQERYGKRILYRSTKNQTIKGKKYRRGQIISKKYI